MIEILATKGIEKEDIMPNLLEREYLKGKSAGIMEGIAQGKYEGFAQGKHEGFTQGKHEGFTQGKHEGFSEGELQNHQNVMIRLLSKKFGLNNAEEEYIRRITSSEKLDKALDAIIEAQTREEVINCLK